MSDADGPVPPSRLAALQALCRRHRSAAAALAVGDYYAAVTCADGSAETIATALSLAGCHHGAWKAFAEGEPRTPLGLFALALTTLFRRGRAAALDRLAVPAAADGPPAALRQVLQDGRVAINFVTAWRHWLDRIDGARRDWRPHGLDVALRTVSFHREADLCIDFNGGAFPALVEAKASGGHAVNVVFDHYEMLPDGFFRSRLPSVKIFVDFHHAVLRNRDDLLSFDHVYCSDPETHQAIRDLTGRDSDIFLPLSDFTPVPVLPPAPPGVDLYFSGAILKDYSPRREALVARIVGACPDATTLFVDGRLPRAEYERLSAGCRLEPVLLEAGAAIPSPRFFQRLNAGRLAVVDDPGFFARAFPDHADLFVGIEEAVEMLAGRAPFPATPQDGTGRPPSEMAPADQLLHMALMAPLLRPARRQARPEPPSRIRSSGYNALLAVQPAQGLGPMWQRAVRSGRAESPPLASLDAARFLADGARAVLFHRGRGAPPLSLGPDIDAALAAILDGATAAGWRPLALLPNVREDPVAERLCTTAMAILGMAIARHPAILVLQVERLRLVAETARDPAHALRLAGALRAMRGTMEAPLAACDPAEVGLPLSDRLARRILAGGMVGEASLHASVEAALWAQVDLEEARSAIRGGNRAAAIRLLQSMLVRDPGDIWAGDLLCGIWRDAGPGGRPASLDGTAFRQALGGLLERAPARIDAYAVPLAEAALADGDRDAAMRIAARFRAWAAKVQLTGEAAERRAAPAAALDRLLAG